MKLDITPDHFRELITKSYSLDIVYLLGLINEGLDVAPLLDSSHKIKAIYGSLIRKQLITDEQKLTKEAIDILDFISKKRNTKILKKKPDVSEFDEWWEMFPSTDIFSFGGKKFNGTRSLKSNKEKCRLEFNKILGEGVFTKDDVIRGTRFDVELKMSNSLKSGSNKLTFLQNSHTYLYNRSFAPFVKLSAEGQIKSPNRTIGSIDI